MPTPPDDLPTYRLLTGPDDASFCRRVSEALALGYELYGSPSVTFNGTSVIAAQAVRWRTDVPPARHASSPSTEELAATVARMEARLSVATHEEAMRLFASYAALVPRFEQDLGASPREVHLAKASALMLVQARAKDGAA